MRTLVAVVAALALLGGVRLAVFGWEGPVDDTECIRGDGAVVCLDRRGRNLELRAAGLLPDSRVRFDGEYVPVTGGGEIGYRRFFATNEYWPAGPIYIEATAGTGRNFAGSIEFTISLD